MIDLAPITRAIDLIECNLQAPISVADMAEAVGYSIYYFCRIFNQATHHTPYDYLMRRRLAEAARDLLSNDRLVIDVALDYQFNSPETFTRAFRRVFDRTPTEARAQGWIDGRRLMPRLTPAHVEHIHKGPYLRPVLEQESVLRVAGVMTLVRRDRGAISALWEWFARQARLDEALDTSGGCYGIACYPDNWQAHGYTYMAAVAVDDPAGLGPGWVMMALPAARYARFIHKGRARDIGLTLDYMWHTWLPKSGHRLARPMLIERYARGFADADADGGERAILIPIG